MSIGAQIDPDSLKAISDTCNKFALDVDCHLTVHRNKQLEQQKAHEERIAHMLTGRQGIWISDRWMKFLFIFFFAFMLIVTLYVKFR